MQPITIEIKPTTRPAIVKFEANKFLTQHESFEFKNIDEATRSPLAQQLFHLPFVKTVYLAQNFVAIEKYNIVYWKDVQEEVAAQIQEYLNNGGVVVNPPKDQENQKIPVTVYTESTPNPRVMKFVSNRRLVLNTVEFKNAQEASQAPVAQALFQFPFVKEVFIDENYLSIQKIEAVEWDEIIFELREFIRSYLEQGKEILTEEAVRDGKAVATTQKTAQTSQPVNHDVSLDGIPKQIVGILDEYVKPAVASDGGNILFDSYDVDNQVVKVILQGACSGCPSSTITLKNGIETMLKEMLPGKVSSVEALNG